MTVHTEVRGSTLLVTLDVPKANAINVDTSMELYGAFVRLREDPRAACGGAHRRR